MKINEKHEKADECRRTKWSFINKMRQFVTDHPLNMTLHDHRGARKIQYHDGDRIIYDNENGIMYHTKHRKEDITQITTKINFDWEQLL